MTQCGGEYKVSLITVRTMNLSLDPMKNEILTQEHWDEEYQATDVAWDTHRPHSELQRVVNYLSLEPCRLLEIGCGTGSDAVWLASRGFDVTGVDLSAVAIDEARQRASAAGVEVDFRVADVREKGAVDGTFDFFFDSGCYCALRNTDGKGYRGAIHSLTRSGGLGLVLTGNAIEPQQSLGPSVVSEKDIRSEWREGFLIKDLREFRFDPRHPGEQRFLGWSCLLQRHSDAAAFAWKSTIADGRGGCWK